MPRPKGVLGANTSPWGPLGAPKIEIILKNRKIMGDLVKCMVVEMANRIVSPSPSTCIWHGIEYKFDVVLSQEMYSKNTISFSTIEYNVRSNFQMALHELGLEMQQSSAREKTPPPPGSPELKNWVAGQLLNISLWNGSLSPGSCKKAAPALAPAASKGMGNPFMDGDGDHVHGERENLDMPYSQLLDDEDDEDEELGASPSPLPPRLNGNRIFHITLSGLIPFIDEILKLEAAVTESTSEEFHSRVVSEEFDSKIELFALNEQSLVLMVSAFTRKPHHHHKGGWRGTSIQGGAVHVGSRAWREGNPVEGRNARGSRQGWKANGDNRRSQTRRRSTSTGRSTIDTPKHKNGHVQHHSQGGRNSRMDWIENDTPREKKGYVHHHSQGGRNSGMDWRRVSPNGLHGTVDRLWRNQQPGWRGGMTGGTRGRGGFNHQQNAGFRGRGVTRTGNAMHRPLAHGWGDRMDVQEQGC